MDRSIVSDTGAFHFTTRQAELTLDVKLALMKNCGQTLTTAEIPAPESYYVFSVVGEACIEHSDMSGQVLDSCAHIFMCDPRFNEIYKLWRAWHLNDLSAANDEQQAALDKWTLYAGASYLDSCAYLKARGLYVTSSGYEYGSKWLLRVIPDAVIAQMQALISRATTEGGTYGKQPS